MKEVVKSLAPHAVNSKMQYIPYRAELQKHFVENFQQAGKKHLPYGPQHVLSKDTMADAGANEKNICAHIAKLTGSALFNDSQNAVGNLRYLFPGVCCINIFDIVIFYFRCRSFLAVEISVFSALHKQRQR